MKTFDIWMKLAGETPADYLYVDIFGLAMVNEAVPPSSVALSFPKMQPVCCPIACAGVSFPVGKGLGHVRFDPVLIFPVDARLFQAQRQDVRSQITDFDPGQDQEAIVIDQAGQK
jgi:hypothetical protein